MPGSRAEEAARAPAECEDRRPGDRRRSKSPEEQPDSKAGKKLASSTKALAISDDDYRRLLRRQRRRWDALKEARGQAVGAAKAPDGPRDRRQAGHARADLAARSRGLLCEEGAPAGRLPHGAHRLEIARGLLERRTAGDRGRIAAPASDGRLADWITDVDQGAGALCRPRDGQSGLAASLRRGPGAHGRRLRRPRRAAHASGAPGVARPRVRRGRLAAQAAPSPDPHERGLHAGYDLRCGPRDEGSRQSPAVAAPAAAAGGRDPARRRAVRERHTEPEALRARVQAARFRPKPCWPATRRTRIPRMPATRMQPADGPSTCSTSGSSSIRSCRRSMARTRP